MPVMNYSKKKVTNFCLNDEVYRGMQSNPNVSHFDQICICVNNTLYFLEAEQVTGIYKYTEDTSPARRNGFSINCSPDQMVWEGKKIYIAYKRD